MVQITFNNSLITSDPKDVSVLIIGRLSKLNVVDYEYLKCKLKPRVTEEVYRLALNKLKTIEICPLYLNSAVIAALPFRCSRHNSPSRSYALTHLISVCCNNGSIHKSVVIVCEYDEVFASGCAVMKAFKIFNKKSNKINSNNITVSVEFIIISSEISANGKLNKIDEISMEELEVLKYAIFGIGIASRITDTPCNEMNVDEFLEEVSAIGALLDIEPTVIRGTKLVDMGFGGILTVGQGSNQPPALAVLSYKPENAEKTIAWVGKGIVFDTGGLCLKGKNDMIRMKQDCGGAAAILGAFYAVVKAGFIYNLHAIFCLAENSIGPLAVRPDDICTLYSGRSVEINNTDAEGRLVVADGAVYAKRNLNADIILDMATLTGAQGIATGKYHAAILTNSGNWEQYCMQAGRTSGDLVFPIPYAPELHFGDYSSIFADMKNSGTSSAASSCAGLFIGAHLGFDFTGTWIHVDMAALVSNGERATGYGVALLCTLFGGFTEQPLLNNIAPKIEFRESRRYSSQVGSSVS